MSERYGVRWRTVTNRHGEILITGWDVVDHRKFDNITVRTFDVSEKVQAEGLAKLLNSIEEENDGLSK